MAKIFNEVEFTKPNSNIFDLSHNRKLSLNMGRLVPIALYETVPGDKFMMSCAHLARLAPLIAPIMHQIMVYVHFFFVPNRLLWPGWEDFITGGEDGMDATVYPYMDCNFSTFSSGSIADYFGLPVATAGDRDVRVSALPIAAYGKIFNEYYRDQNLGIEAGDECVDGDNTSTFGVMANAECFRRAWQHDYFTSALPWTQKGPEATIPLGSTAPVEFKTGIFASIARNPDGTLYTATQQDVEINTSSALQGKTLTDPLAIDNSLNLQVNLSDATAAGIIDLRRAFKLQEWLERNARGGTRYTESILAHFGVKSSDARLQRPEFIGGSATPINISEVLQTSAVTGQPTPQGNMAGHGISAGQSGGISYFCEEHGWIVGIMSIMPKTGYYQGVHKLWKKFDKFDHYWPEFAHIGEQAIIKEELYVSDNQTNDEAVFGYIPRYSEYKYHNNTVHGLFRINLEYWHLDRKFGSLPALNQSFIDCNPDEQRVFTVGDTETIYAIVQNNVKVSRRMPYFGSPKM